TAASESAACTPIAARPNEAQIRAALLSAHFFAFYDSDAGLPDEYKPIPLSTAVDILVNDVSSGSKDRRLRAAVALAGAGARGARKTALERLVPVPVAAAAAVSIPRDPPRDEQSRREREVQLYDLLSKSIIGPETLACERTRPTIAFDEREGVVQATYTIDVKLAANQLARALDPLAWPQCSKFFASTCVVDRTERGGYAVAPEPPELGSHYDRL